MPQCVCFSLPLLLLREGLQSCSRLSESASSSPFVGGCLGRTGLAILEGQSLEEQKVQVEVSERQRMARAHLTELVKAGGTIGITSAVT